MGLFLEAYELASIFPVAILSIRIGFNFHLRGEAEVEVDLSKLGSAQLQQGIFPYRAVKPTHWLHFSLLGPGS
jgi:hypothetical protein